LLTDRVAHYFLGDNKFFVEVGAWHGIKDSNTFVLETEYSWSGIAFEVIPKFRRRYNRVRNSHCIQADVTDVDFRQIFKEHGVPKRVDYLQLDVDPATVTLSALVKIPFDTHRFSVITFEHDLYRLEENKYVKKWSEDFLTEHNYTRVVSNVKYNGMAFEDWWVDSSVCDSNFIAENLNSDIEWENLFQKGTFT
jgi:hypothetical protein